MSDYIYISGKITGTDDYLERFAKAEKALTDKGYTVVNPAKVNAQLPTTSSYRFYMDKSLVMLSHCDKIYMLTGWENSNGAKLEHDFAVDNDINILYEDDCMI